MKRVSPDDRPREKLARHGAKSLGDNELVAAVLGTGCRSTDALTLANELLAVRGGVHGLVRSSCDDLARVAGIGRAKSAQVLAAVELGRRTLSHAPSARVQLRTPRDAAAYLLPQFGSRPVEQFGLVLLDTKHRVLRATVLAIGSLNATGVQPREVFREAALGSAAFIVMFHNHPSGDPSPSPDDVELTRRLVAAGLVMGIEVVDHIILGDVRYWSFKEMGHL
ncbi:MAG: DNA repair protein RadC [Acidobacteriota bacterium]